METAFREDPKSAGKITARSEDFPRWYQDVVAAGQLAEVQVWKDVDGMMSADPRVVEQAVPVPFVTYEEAAELAYFGASVLHPISMLPAQRADIPVRVKNSREAVS